MMVRPPGILWSLLAAAIVGFAGAASLAQETLPQTVETPSARPRVEAAPAALPEAGEAVPVPKPRPVRSASPPSGTASPHPEAGEPAMKAGEVACRTRLQEFGVAFENVESRSDPSGCRMAHPVRVSALGKTVRLDPPALLNCATAETAANLVKDVIDPEARSHFGSPVAAVRQVSGYVCRPRAGTRKLSEHAFGNALDIAAFELADGTVVKVREHGEHSPSRSSFVEDVREAACGPFKTVLGPGTDADHADHFHFDLAERRNGGTYCR